MLPLTNSRSLHAEDFIDDDQLERLARPVSVVDAARLTDIVAKAMNKEPLGIEETAYLLHAQSPELRHEVLQAAKELKRRVYGNRIVLFAPLYIGNRCVNDCVYCGFRRSNLQAIRRTLDMEELRREVEVLEQQGHKRLIVVFGEHGSYDAEFMSSCIRNIYQVQVGNGEIRRLNVNAAPLDHEGFRLMKAAGIGTYQIFMETYHHATYERMHPRGTRKADYLWRLDALNRAFEAGLDDVGIGALFGLADWRFDTLGLVRHAIFLKERYGCGPHTISFPRLRPASGVDLPSGSPVSDEDFKFMIAVLRLAVPYTGLILTARENAALRREAIECGVSQIDAGSNVELGGYAEGSGAQRAEREQFMLGDTRSLEEVIRELISIDHIPSFCTACYRLGRTGEHFMEFAVPGFIKRFCTPNALTTFLEYLVDYATSETRATGLALIEREVNLLEPGPMKQLLIERLGQIQTSNKRDLYF
jgi:2-iminoacetate synthase